MRRECTTCHSNTVASASNAPQIDVTRVNHLASAGTPLANMLTEPDEACETCHMPKSSGSGSHMHLFRINTASTYQTMGAGQVQHSADGAYASAGWVEHRPRLRPCHYTSGVVNAGSHRPGRSSREASWPLRRGAMHPATASSNPGTRGRANLHVHAGRGQHVDE